MKKKKDKKDWRQLGRIRKWKEHEEEENKEGGEIIKRRRRRMIRNAKILTIKRNNANSDTP